MLKPAGRTLSSLTGIVVLAAVLWLILNFIYAPSCGRIASLREADAKVTTGLFYEPDGTEHTYRSGYDGYADRAKEALREAGVEFPPVGEHPAAAHVATKIAAFMRDNHITFGVVVINNRRGPCGADPTIERRFSCGVAVPAILPEGSTLAVWFPGAVESTKLRGQASD